MLVGTLLAVSGAALRGAQLPRSPLVQMSAAEAALLSPSDAQLLELSASDVRAKTTDELEVLIAELEAAAANFVDATPDDRPSVTLSRLLATAHTCYGDHELCVPHAKAALDGGGEDADMHFLLGVAAERRMDEDVALDEYETAIDLDPKCWRALFHVGKIALAFGAIDMGIEHFRKVAEINPEHAATKAFLTSFDASPAAEAEDDEDEENLPLPESLTSFDVDPEGL